MSQSTHDAGHRETQIRLPELLDGSPAWHPRGWGMPGPLLASISCGTFVTVLLWAWAMADLALFRLPFHPFWLAAPAALTAWWIVLRCRRRPGSLPPRIWNLMLAMIATGTVASSLTDSRFAASPWLDVAALAAALGTLALAARLGHLSPHRRHIQHVGAAVLGSMLLAGLPACHWLIDRSIALRKERLAKMPEELDLLREKLAEIAGHPWVDMSRDLDAARKQVARLKELEIDRWAPDRSDWRAVSLLEDEADSGAARRRLQASWQALDNAVVRWLLASRAPILEVPSWHAEPRGWIREAGFETAVDVTRTYHRVLLEHHRRLDPGCDSEPRAPNELCAVYGAQRRRIDGHLENLAQGWATRWLAHELARRPKDIPPAWSSLAEALGGRLVPEDEQSLRPGEIWKLMDVRADAVDRMVGLGPGCSRRDLLRDGRDGGLRLSCESYRLEGRGKMPEMEVRMSLYFPPVTPGVRADAVRPEELEYVLVLSNGAGEQELLEGLYRAARAQEDEAEAHLAAGGFDLLSADDPGERIEVRPAQKLTLTGAGEALRVSVKRRD